MERLGLARSHSFRNAVTRDGNGLVPCWVGFDGQAWRNGFSAHRAEFEALRSRCPDVSLSIPPQGQEVGRAGEVRTTDAWGCEWLYNTTCGDGQVVSHPLKDLSAVADWALPDPGTYMDWDALRRQVNKARQAGEPAGIWLEHGFFYLRLTYLRGFDNLMVDIAEQSPEFLGLLERFTGFWVDVAGRLADLNPDIVYWADDLGMQSSLPMSPSHWRQLMRPGYARVMEACSRQGALNSLHTDGYIVDIIPDLIACGLEVVNPQDLVNGLDNLARVAKGRVSVNLDIDRQSLTPFGKPEDIREHIGRCVRTLGSPTGGLSLTYGVYSGVPVENVVAVVEAMQQYHDFWTKALD